MMNKAQEARMIEKLSAVKIAQEQIAEARASLTAALALSLEGVNSEEQMAAADGCIDRAKHALGSIE